MTLASFDTPCANPSHTRETHGRRIITGEAITQIGEGRWQCSDCTVRAFEAVIDGLRRELADAQARLAELEPGN